MSITTYTRCAQSFADGDAATAEMYDDTRSQMLTEHQALTTIIKRAAEPYAITRRGSADREQLMAALHYASIAFDGYTLEDADLAFGVGAR